MKSLNLLQLTEDEAREYLEKIRWPDGPACLFCGDTKSISRVGGEKHRKGLLHCKGCRKQFTVSVGTIFEGSHIPLHKWIIAFNLMCSSKKGISALQLSRQLGITYKSAWHLAHRVRHAMKTDLSTPSLNGTVEVDETYVGGSARNRRRRQGLHRGRGTQSKAPVIALVQRDGGVISHPIDRVSSKTLKDAILTNVERTATIMTDDWRAYKGIGKYYAGGHSTVNHSRHEYVRGEVYTNTAESFFALLKRGVYGSFHHVSKRHLPRYCNEFAFRWNTRKSTDSERTAQALQMVEGKRLYYKWPHPI